MIVSGVLLKAGYGVCCIAAASVLVVSNYARSTVGAVTGLGTSHAIQSGPSVGAQNILLMGLESRTDYDGNILPADLLAAMHAGSVQGVEDGVGGQDTNTLILIHVFDGGKKATGISIPRDDWVTYPKAYDGQSQGKIDQAYGLAWAQSLSQTANDSSMSHDQRYFQANEAGQAAAVATVEQVTGQHVDHFAEVNLAGFYELAKAFDGIMVCLKSYNGGENLHDANSGFRAPHAGYLHLAADQALAFVRERDNLPNGDLDRTHRQQAVIDYVIWKLEHQGVLSSFGQLTDLLNIAKQYVITDAGWDILDFAGEMRALTGKNLTFVTAPIVAYTTIDGQDANEISVPAIQAEAKAAFTAPAGSSSGKKTTSKSESPEKKTATTTYPLSDSIVDVYNAGYTAGLASSVSSGLVSAGFVKGFVGDAGTKQSATEVLYGSGAAAQANAAKVAALFGGTAQPSDTVSAGHVEVILGSSATLPSFSSLSSASTTSTSSATSSSTSVTPAPSSPPSSTSGSAASNGASGGVVSVGDNAPYGIPCVY